MKNHSTESALLRVLNDTALIVDSGNSVILVLLDLSAAFDTVDHDIVLSCLKMCVGIQGTALSWFRSYLSNRTFSVGIVVPFYLQHALPVVFLKGLFCLPFYFHFTCFPLGSIF